VKKKSISFRINICFKVKFISWLNQKMDSWNQCDGEHNICCLEDVLPKLKKQDELLLVLIGGANYYTGQAFDETIIPCSQKAEHT
jgi:hypothetical protein